MDFIGWAWSCFLNCQDWDLKNGINLSNKPLYFIFHLKFWRLGKYSLNIKLSLNYKLSWQKSLRKDIFYYERKKLVLYNFRLNLINANHNFHLICFWIFFFVYLCQDARDKHQKLYTFFNIKLWRTFSEEQ